MHLSMFSDSFLFHRLDESGALACAASAGVAHRDGLMRGLAVIAAFAVVVGLATISGAVHSADADAALAAPAPIATSGSAERHVLRLRALDPASVDWTRRLRQ